LRFVDRYQLRFIYPSFWIPAHSTVCYDLGCSTLVDRHTLPVRYACVVRVVRNVTTAVVYVIRSCVILLILFLLVPTPLQPTTVSTGDCRPVVTDFLFRIRSRPCLCYLILRPLRISAILVPPPPCSVCSFYRYCLLNYVLRVLFTDCSPARVLPLHLLTLPHLFAYRTTRCIVTFTRLVPGYGCRVTCLVRRSFYVTVYLPAVALLDYLRSPAAATAPLPTAYRSAFVPR